MLEREDGFKPLNNFLEKDQQSHGRLKTGIGPKTNLRGLVSTNTPVHNPHAPALPNSGCASHWLLSGRLD